MKSLLLSLLVFSSAMVQCSTIDKLKTTEDVETFVKTYNKEITKSKAAFQIKTTEQLAIEHNCDGLFTEWDIKNWEKVDFNNDGKTDLFFIADWQGTHPMIALDLGKDSYKFIRLRTDPFQKCELFKPIRFNNLNLIKTTIKRPSSTGNSISVASNISSTIDTLGFYKDILVRYNPNPKKEAIKSIKITTTMCFGQCPEFTLEIFDNLNAKFNGIKHTPVLGEQNLAITEKDFEELTDLLNYIDVKSLKSNYAVSWSDDQTVYLDVVFADGSKKRIQDYGRRGTPGLKSVYEKMFNIALNKKTM